MHLQKVISHFVDEKYNINYIHSYRSLFLHLFFCVANSPRSIFSYCQYLKKIELKS